MYARSIGVVLGLAGIGCCLALAAPACASDEGVPPRWSVEAGWWKSALVVGSSYDRRWPSGPAFGLSADLLRHVKWSGFARLEHASIATDVGAVERYYFGATAASEDRTEATLITVGLRARPWRFGRFTTHFEFAPGIAIVKEAAFRYTYASTTYTVPEDAHAGRVLIVGMGLEHRTAAGYAVYFDARAGVMRLHDIALPLNGRVGVRFW